MDASTDGEVEALLADVERGVRRALRTGRSDDLEVLGYGEISCVIAVRGDGGTWAVKRLPRFESDEAFSSYREAFSEYLRTLETAGVVPLDSTLRVIPDAEPGVQAYCVQPLLDAGRLGPAVLESCAAEEGRQFLEEIVTATTSAVDERLGLDAQLSNWVLSDEGLRYLDITTPMLRDADGADRLDTGLFVAALPWALRGVTDAFLADRILDQYHNPRSTLLDLAANLHKEGLQDWIPPLLELANPHVGRPITEEECSFYYRRDARMWAVLLSLRRLDRAWQRHIRRRSYPFLLPGKIER